MSESMGGLGPLGPTQGGTGQPQGQPAPRPVISHDRGPGIGGGGGEPLPQPGAPKQQPPSKIQLFEQRLGGKKHEDKWNRTPNLTGTGAIHCRSFHCKLVGESLEFLDQQINEWLDAHPQYEVKFVTTTVGEWTGKIREPNLVVQVWV